MSLRDKSRSENIESAYGTSALLKDAVSDIEEMNAVGMTDSEPWVLPRVITGKSVRSAIGTTDN